MNEFVLKNEILVKGSLKATLLKIFLVTRSQHSEFVISLVKVTEFDMNWIYSLELNYYLHRGKNEKYSSSKRHGGKGKTWHDELKIHSWKKYVQVSPLSLVPSWKELDWNSVRTWKNGFSAYLTLGGGSEMGCSPLLGIKRPNNAQLPLKSMIMNFHY